MRVLMIAPEPFFQPRGTPFSELYRIRCLAELGHGVDLVTYPVGQDVSIDGLRIFRTVPFPGISRIAIGPSLAKIPLDLLLFFKSWQLLRRGRYDVIHTHEEAGIMGVFFSRLYSLPHIYDMHSSLPQQLSNFKFSKSRLLKAGFDWMESVVVTSAEAIIAICPSLVDTVLGIDPSANVTLIENTAESHQVDNVSSERLGQLRRQHSLQGKQVILYIGTFEAYQGLELLLLAWKRIAESRGDAVLLLVGGTREQVQQKREEARALGLADSCRFIGQVPHPEVPQFLRLADALVSPRIRGTNTPLKIYSYLRSGAPIVATNLRTHTQVLNSNVALLCPPEPEPFADAIAAALDNRDLAGRLAANALRLSEERYSYSEYVRKTRLVYGYIEQQKDGRKKPAL